MVEGFSLFLGEISSKESIGAEGMCQCRFTGKTPLREDHGASYAFS